jgi:hypothetical protein
VSKISSSSAFRGGWFQILEHLFSDTVRPSRTMCATSSNMLMLSVCQ